MYVCVKVFVVSERSDHFCRVIYSLSLLKCIPNKRQGVQSPVESNHSLIAVESSRCRSSYAQSDLLLTKLMIRFLKLHINILSVAKVLLSGSNKVRQIKKISRLLEINFLHHNHVTEKGIWTCLRVCNKNMKLDFHTGCHCEPTILFRHTKRNTRV